ncbi:MAG: twin-arginine translocation pathway signal [Chryseobacterium sp.]|nr:MAG: twin-arginine translocation pathway signal [Chryseobacterium sp.]
MIINRKNFIKTSSLAAASFFFPNFLEALTLPEAIAINGKTLIILQLSGGNDGLNTIIPVKNDIYYKLRNKISIKEENALLLTDEAGINPDLKFFKELYDNGELAVMNNVGYPEPSKSHFRSMDIWQSASSSNQFINSGWLGRYLDEACHDCQNPTQAIEVDDLLSLAMKGNHNKAIAFKDPKKLYDYSVENFYKQITTDGHNHDLASYMYNTLGSTINNSEYIFEESKAKPTDKAYPTTQIGKDFKTIASLVKSDINTQVYYLSIGSFDTHYNQNKSQSNLFKMIDQAIRVFVKDMKENGKFNDVMIMTFSEFGRRVAQNASNGTDHGTANQMFFISGGLKKKGLLNPLPDLTKLKDGDLIYTEDFRKVYATVLKRWLNSDDKKILGKDNGYYDFI